MEVVDNAQFRNRLVALAEVFDVKLSPQRVALYFEALRDLDFPRVIEALNQAVKACTFFPKPAELRTLAIGDSEDRTENAWMAFRQAMKKAGSYASLSVADAALGETIIAMFGNWPAACSQELTQEMWSSKRKEFGRVYRVMCSRNLDGSRYLPGICEQQNARPDWMKFVPVHRLDAQGLTSLSLEQGEQERTQIAAKSHGFTRLSDIPALKLIPKKLEDAG